MIRRILGFFLRPIFLVVIFLIVVLMGLFPDVLARMDIVPRPIVELAWKIKLVLFQADAFTQFPEMFTSLADRSADTAIGGGSALLKLVTSPGGLMILGLVILYLARNKIANFFRREDFVDRIFSPQGIPYIIGIILLVSLVAYANISGGWLNVFTGLTPVLVILVIGVLGYMFFPNIADSITIILETLVRGTLIIGAIGAVALISLGAARTPLIFESSSPLAGVVNYLGQFGTIIPAQIMLFSMLGATLAISLWWRKR